jgi:anaerobic selenocysteine-containing dehydrogenase
VGSKRGVDLREAAEHAELLVIWGGNPVTTQVNVMQHAIAAKKRGAKLVVVDPTAPAPPKRPTCICPCAPAPTARWRAQ